MKKTEKIHKQATKHLYHKLSCERHFAGRRTAITSTE